MFMDTEMEASTPRHLAEALGIVKTSKSCVPRKQSAFTKLKEEEKMTQMFQRVIGVISNTPEKRKRSEIDVLLPWLRKRSELLEKAEKDVLISLMKRCGYQKKQKDDVIITQGDIGDSFYIILSGRCSVFIDTLKSGEDKADPSKSKVNNKPAEDSQNEAIKTIMSVRGEKQKLDRSKYGRHISTMGVGKSFGEIALISEDSVRNASIIADEETDLLVIERELFNEKLKAKQEEEYQERSAFVNKCPLFANWNARFKKLLEMSLIKVTLPFGSPIVKQGDPFSGLYFIAKGEGKVVLDSSTHESQFPRLYDPSNSLLAKELGQSFTRKTNKTRESLQQEQVRIRRRHGYAAAEKRLSQKAVTLCFVDETEVIGDAELVLGLDTYLKTVVCTANTELFLLDNKNIDRLITKKNPYTVDILRLSVENKLKARSKTKLGSQISLFSQMLVALEISKPKRLTVDPVRTYETIVSDEQREKETAIKQLIKLYLTDRSPLIEPYVPNAVYYKTKAVQKSQRPASAAKIMASSQNVTGQLRLDRARRAAKRQPRSRRELERLTIAQDPDEVSKLQDRNHAVNRFLQREPSGTTQPRRKSSIADSTDAVYQLTEPQLQDNGDELDVTDISEEEVKESVINLGNVSDATNASRARVICNMMEQNTQQNANKNYKNLLRPKSAPASRLFGDEDNEAEVFDTETSDAVLGGLEQKIKHFYSVNREANDAAVRRMVPQIQKLKRFQIKKPDDVPVPGGTVYVRQRNCKYPPGSHISSSQHQHVRRFLIPKDAYAVATASMELIQNAVQQEPSLNGSSVLHRPSSAPVHYKKGTQLSNGGVAKVSQRPKTAVVRMDGRKKSISETNGW